MNEEDVNIIRELEISQEKPIEDLKPKRIITLYDGEDTSKITLKEAKRDLKEFFKRIYRNADNFQGLRRKMCIGMSIDEIIGRCIPLLDCFTLEEVFEKYVEEALLEE